MKTSRYEPSPVPLLFVFGLSALQAVSFFALGVLLSCIFGPKVVPMHLVFSSMYVCEVLSLLTHWLGHRRSNWKILNYWYEAHTLGHHISDYPTRKFLTNGYEPAIKDNSVGYIPALFITPFFVAPFSLSSFLVSWAAAYAMLIVADVLHMALHVRGHSWERFQWFQHLRSLHYWHHAGTMRQNYAIGDFFLDYLFLGFKRS